MRVDLNTPPMELPVGPLNQGRAAGHHSPEAITPENATAGVDQVRFSFDQARIQSLQAQVLAQPDVREAKVRALGQAIAKGEYAVSSSQLADAMLAELGGSRS